MSEKNLSKLAAAVFAAGLPFFDPRQEESVHWGPHLGRVTLASGAKAVGDLEAVSTTNTLFDPLNNTDPQNRKKGVIFGLGVIVPAKTSAADMEDILRYAEVHIRANNVAKTFALAEALRMGGVLTTTNTATEGVGGCPTGQGGVYFLKRGIIFGVHDDDAISIRWAGTPTLDAAVNLIVPIYAPFSQRENAEDIKNEDAATPYQGCSVPKTAQEIAAQRRRLEMLLG